MQCEVEPFLLLRLGLNANFRKDVTDLTIEIDEPIPVSFKFGPFPVIYPKQFGHHYVASNGKPSPAESSFHRQFFFLFHRTNSGNATVITHPLRSREGKKRVTHRAKIMVMA